MKLLSLFRILPFLFVSFIYSDIPLFQPPLTWECAFPQKASQYIQIGFVGKGSTSFRPSINLAIEQIDFNLKQYIKAVKQIHESEPNTTWRDLGKFLTLSGEGRLTEITSLSPFGTIKMLQLILVKKNKAYIMTGAATKEDFLQCQHLFTTSFKSLTLVSDLLDLLSKEQKNQITDLLISVSKDSSIEEKNHCWNELQKKVLEVSNLGVCWQFFVLKQGREAIFQWTESLTLIE